MDTDTSVVTARGKGTCGGRRRYKGNKSNGKNTIKKKLLKNK